IRYGYMNGIALSVLISQVPKMLGFSIDKTGPLVDSWRIVDAIAKGKAGLAPSALGLGTLATILVLKRWPRVPGTLVAVVAATVAVGLLHLGPDVGVAILGP